VKGDAPMLYKVAICDDEEKEVKKVDDFLMDFSMKFNVDFKISRFSCGESLVREYAENKSPFDIIFLDIEMKELNGIQTAEKVRKSPDRNVLIVFITCYPEYMQDSFDVQASQYLTKPLSYEHFEEKLQRILCYLNELDTNITVVSLKDGNIILHLEDVLYIETAKSATLKSNLIVTTTSEKISIKGKIAGFEQELKSNHFIALHRSVLANMKYIRRFSTNMVVFTNGDEVEFSRRKAAEVKEAFSKYTVMRYKR
jgi:DNA-binding LytR/AlgR family response regulator